MPQSPTIRDVAKACGCSIYTVSAVLNGKGRISEALRNKVRQTARELGYDALRNMPLARRLTAPALAFVVPNILAENDAFFWNAVSTARNFSATNNYDFKMFAEQDLAVRLANEEATPVAVGFDRLVICCCDPPKAVIRQIMRKGIPVALIRREMDLPGIVIVKDDDTRGMQLAMAHLHQTYGHTKIGVLAPQYTGPVTACRRESYLDYVRQNRLVDDPDLAIDLSTLGKPLPEHLCNLVRAGRMTALIAMSDGLTIDAAKHLLRAGIRIPQEVSVISYSNTSLAASFYPELTAVNVPVVEMVTAACQSLFNLAAKTAPARTVIEFTNDLVVRESCGAAPRQ